MPTRRRQRELQAAREGHRETARTGFQDVGLLAGLQPQRCALERADVTLAGRRGRMRAGDHQFQQPLVVSVMDRAGAPGVRHDVEGSGFGFRTLRRFEPGEVEMPHRCKMPRIG